MLGGEPVEEILVEQLAETAGAIPERYLSLRFNAKKLVENVRAHGRHAGAAADENHFGVGLFGEEFAERAEDVQLVSRPQREQI